MRMDESKEKHTNIYPSLCIHSPADAQAYINTDTHIHICYSSQKVLFKIMFQSI